MTNELILPTRVAHAGFHQPYFFGYRVYEELLYKETFTGIVALAITGKLPSKDERKFLDDVAAILTLADARIWPIKTSRVVASYGSAMIGIACGTLCMNSFHIGPNAIPPCARLFVEIRKTIDNSIEKKSEEELVTQALNKYKMIPGFGVPGRKDDERVPMLRESLSRRARQHLPYWRLFELLVEKLGKKGVKPNMGSAVSAALLDMDYQPEEVGLFCTTVCLNAILPNAVESSHQMAEVLHCLPEETIEYVGRGARVSPRAAAKNS